MGVHVGEIHTQVSSSAPAAEPGAATGSSSPAGGAGAAAARPGAAEEAWRRTSARVTQLRCRVAAEGFDD